MKAIKKILCMVLAMTTVGTAAVHAQRVTYNHDSSKKNQVTVMELGSGSLSPELYYTLLHRNYKQSAAQKNKQTFRTAASIALYNQVDEAEAIDSALTARAKIEALNVTDRTVDVAWLAEGSKINSKMGDFKRTSTVSFLQVVTSTRNNDGRNIITSFNALSSPPKKPTCPMLNGRKCI